MNQMYAYITWQLHTVRDPYVILDNSHCCILVIGNSKIESCAVRTPQTQASGYLHCLFSNPCTPYIPKSKIREYALNDTRTTNMILFKVYSLIERDLPRKLPRVLPEP